MKKIIIPFVFICFSSALYSQEIKTELTEEQKQELRKNHNNGLQFTGSKSSTAKQLKTSNTSEEKDIKVTNVKYYHGTEDSTYKQFKYIKPE